MINLNAKSNSTDHRINLHNNLWLSLRKNGSTINIITMLWWWHSMDVLQLACFFYWENDINTKNINNFEREESS